MSTLLDFARTEMRAAGLYDTDADYGGSIPLAVEEIVEVFAGQSHSGMSAAIVTSLLGKLLRFEPIGPLTGADDEWTEVSDGLWQNRRCGRVFKGADGVAYDIDGKVFREPNGACYTSRDSRVEVQFPYTPTTQVIDVPERA